MTVALHEEPKKWFLPGEGLETALSDAKRTIGPEARIWAGRHKGVDGHWVKPYAHATVDSKELTRLKERSESVLEAAIRLKSISKADTHKKENDQDHGKAQPGHRGQDVEGKAVNTAPTSKQSAPHIEANEGSAPSPVDKAQTSSANTGKQPETLQNNKVGPSLNDLAEEYGWQVGAEKFLWEQPPTSVIKVTTRGFLGRGVIGEIHEVRISGFNKPMVRKRMNIRRQYAKQDKESIRHEIENLKSLDHRHIVKVLGCYQEQVGQNNVAWCALMLPSGNNDLGMFLGEVYPQASEGQKSTYCTWAKSWFLCLASALAYMHSHNIHHEDIKPSNIIHQGSRIFFTDFSSSRRLESGLETSTVSPASATRLFAAPEAMSSNGVLSRHGSKTDVFSLGVVFVELMTILSGSVTQLRKDVDVGPGKPYHTRVDRLPAWFSTGSRRASALWEACVRQMLNPDRQKRPSAKQVVDSLTGEDFKIAFRITYTCECAKEHYEQLESTEENKVVTTVQPKILRIQRTLSDIPEVTETANETKPPTSKKKTPNSKGVHIQARKKVDALPASPPALSSPKSVSTAEMGPSKNLTPEVIQSNVKDDKRAHDNSQRKAEPTSKSINTSSDKAEQKIKAPKNEYNGKLKQPGTRGGKSSISTSSKDPITSEGSKNATPIITTAPAKRSSHQDVRSIQEPPAKSKSSVLERSSDGQIRHIDDIDIPTSPKAKANMANYANSSSNHKDSLAKAGKTLNTRTQQKEQISPPRQSVPSIIVNDTSLYPPSNRARVEEINSRFSLDGDIIEVIEDLKVDRTHSASPRPRSSKKKKKKRSTSVHSTAGTDFSTSESTVSLPVAIRQSRKNDQSAGEPGRFSRFMGWGGGLSL
ncbi:kinase-like protein [Macroventuria anomochaeta]|uniref:Kinase-like protein n=1 Tax=Macroventuria anomochaeta TaxID=301207 RepID=A0ACB6S5I9_9PLEO|nr:kinase-like protein [Macroventuria anomochaeta]KAF2629252.1 kinase-like protein [Macroventuria anomochaeta]